MSSAVTAANEGLSALLRALGGSSLATLKSTLGRKPLAERLGLNEHEQGAFEATLADVQRWQSAPADAPRREDFLELAALAALQWLEVLAPRINAGWTPDLKSNLTDEAAATRVRALELVLRELVHESYRTQDALMARLRQVFRAETSAKWERSPDPLTGMSFGELASFVISTEEYPRYQPLLEVEHFLAMMRERRKTLRSYLDALRLVRNALAHHKPLSAVQRCLVDRYASEIFAPVSVSWREGRTTVNPETHLQTSDDELRTWLDALTEEVREVQTELAALTQDVANTRRDVSALEGAVVLILAAGLFFVLTVAVSAFSALTAPAGMPNLEQAAVTTARSVRGLLVAAFTFGLAVLRVVLNLSVFRGGARAGLRSWLTGRRALIPLGAWTALGLAVLFAPIHIAAVETPFRELDAQGAFLSLDEAGVARYLARGGDPNATVYGNSLVHLTIQGVAFVDGGVADDGARRARVMKQLLAAGAKVTDADRAFAKVMGKETLLPSP